jgi:hypothetical protein
MRLVVAVCVGGATALCCGGRPDALDPIGGPERFAWPPGARDAFARGESGIPDYTRVRFTVDTLDEAMAFAESVGCIPVPLDTERPWRFPAPEPCDPEWWRPAVPPMYETLGCTEHEVTPERIIQLDPGPDGVVVYLRGFGWSNR